MSPELLQQLMDYTFWGFERVWACTEPLTEDQFLQPLAYSMGSIRNHFVHVMSGTRRWLQRLQQVEVAAHLNFDDYPNRAATRQMWDAGRAEIMAYVRGLTQAQLQESVTWEISTRNWHCTNTRAQLLMQIINHATDHRAQMLAMLHEHFNVPTVEQDWIIYLTEQP
jgi:uncharacterized damage-inducible protein DinB